MSYSVKLNGVVNRKLFEYDAGVASQAFHFLTCIQQHSMKLKYCTFFSSVWWNIFHLKSIKNTSY